MREHYTIKIGTVRGRHEMPVDYYVFEEIDPNDMFRFEIMQGLAIAEIIKIMDKEYETLIRPDDSVCTIEIYYTGFTVATFHVLNAIKTANQGATKDELLIYAMAHNRETGEYHRQMVLL